MNRAFTAITGLEPTQLLNRDFTVPGSDRRSNGFGEKNSAARLTHYIGVLTDISERQAGQARIVHVEHHDPLTDLPNRALLADRQRQAIVQAGGRTRA